MIRVTVELLPHGFEAGKRTLGVMYITNDGTGTQYIGHYNVDMRGANDRSEMACTKVEGFRRRSRHAWELVHLALRAALGQRARRTKWMRGS